MKTVAPVKIDWVPCLVALIVGGCALASPRPAETGWQIESQSARLSFDPSRGDLSVSTRLTLVNRGRVPRGTIWLSLGIEPSLGPITARDRQGRHLMVGRSTAGFLRIEGRQQTPPGASAEIRLDYSIDSDASECRGLERAGPWLTITEEAGLLPVAPPGSPVFRLVVTCLGPPGTTGVVNGTYTPEEAQPDGTTRFVVAATRGRLTGAFGPLRPVRTGARHDRLMMWVGPRTPASRCQELGGLVGLLDRSLTEQLGQAAAREPIVVIEQPGPHAFATDRCLMVPSIWLDPAAGEISAGATLEIGSLLARRYLRAGGRARPLDDDLVEGFAAFLTVRSMQRAQRVAPSREMLAALAASFRSRASDSIPSRPDDRTLAPLLVMADDLFSEPGQSVLTETLNRLRLGDRPAGSDTGDSRSRPGREVAWQELRRELESRRGACNAVAILDWLDHPAPLTIYYSWSAGTEPGGTRTVLFARSEPPVPLRGELLLWSPSNQRLEPIEIDAAQPDLQIMTSFLPAWVELDPDRLVPGTIVPEPTPTGRPEGGRTLLKACMDRMQWSGEPAIESLRVGTDPCLTWTADRGMWLTRPDASDRRLTTLGLSLLTDAVSASSDVRALADPRPGVRRDQELEILVGRHPRARLAIDAESHRLRSVLLIDPEGHREAFLEFDRYQEDAGALQPTRIRVAAPSIAEDLVVESRTAPREQPRR